MVDTDETDRWARRIAENTERLRTHPDPTLQRIRELLSQQGVDIHQSLVANIMPEDTNLLSGLVVANDGRVYEFEFDWRRKRPEEGCFVVWRDLTDTYQSRAFREPIAGARAIVGRQSQTIRA